MFYFVSFGINGRFSTNHYHLVGQQSIVLLHGDHTIASSGLNTTWNLFEVTFTYAIAHSRSVEKKLIQPYPTKCISGYLWCVLFVMNICRKGDQLLSEWSQENIGKSISHTILLCYWEKRNKPRNGIDRRLGMKGTQNKMSGLSDGQYRLGRLSIAYLPYKYNIRVLSQEWFETTGEINRIMLHLSLRENTFFWLIDKLDRIFDGDNMFGKMLIDKVETCGQCGRLPRSGDSCDEKQSSWCWEYLLFDGCGQRCDHQLIKLKTTIADLPYSQRTRSLFEETIDPITISSGTLIGTIDLLVPRKYRSWLFFNLLKDDIDSRLIDTFGCNDNLTIFSYRQKRSRAHHYIWYILIRFNFC